MNFTSTAEALAVLTNTGIDEVERSQAARFLGHHAEPAVITTLIERLEDTDAGVRWAAAEALAGLGQTAFVPLLEVLAKAPANSLLCSGALYVVAHSGSYAVRHREAQLRPALEGPAGGHSAMRAAQELLQEMQTT